MNNALLAMMIGEGAAASIATFTDDFNRADGPLTSPWTNPPGTHANAVNIVSNEAKGTASVDSFAVVSTPTFAANQKATATLKTFSANDHPGVAVRGNTSNAACYIFTYNLGLTRFEAYLVSDTGSLGYNLLAVSSPVTPDVGDPFSLEVVTNGGTSDFIGRADGTSVLTFSDSTIASGQPCIRLWQLSALDDFSATDI